MKDFFTAVIRTAREKTGLAAFIGVMLIISLALVNSAFGQDVDYDELGDWGKLRHHLVYDYMDLMNPRFPNIDSVDVGEEIYLPDGRYRAARNDHFHSHATAYLIRYPDMVHAWVADGRPTGIEALPDFFRSYMSQSSPVTTPEGQGVAQEGSTEPHEVAPVQTESADEQSNSATAPRWVVAMLFGMMVATAFFLAWMWSKRRAYEQMLEREQESKEELQQTIAELREEMRELLPPIDDGNDVFTDRPFREHGGDLTPGSVYSDLDHLAHAHLGVGWQIDRSTIERGIIRAKPDVISMFRYNPHGEPEESETLDRRVEVTGFRAVARRGDEEQYVYALASCMNFAETDEDGEIEFIRQERVEINPLIGTYAEIVDVEEPTGSDRRTTVTLRHPQIEDTFVAWPALGEEEVS